MPRAACAIALLFVLCLPAGAAEPSWQGRPLREYIEFLRDEGLRVIYSTDLVLPGYRLAEEPAGAGPEARLRSAVEPFGLAIAAGPAGALLVTKAADPAPAAPATIGRPAGEPEVPAPRPLPEIVVTSSLYNIRYEHAGSYSFLDRDLSTRMPNLGDEAVRAIARLPGTSSDGVSTRHHVRGGAQNEQLFVLDGLRLYEPYHLKDFHSVATIVDQNAISGIDFYSAGYPARYGDRMSGVVDIRLREPPEHTETELGASFFNTWGLSRGRFGGDDRGDWLFSARRGNLDLLADAVNPDYGSPRYADYIAHVGWFHGDHYLSANALYSYDRISISDGDASRASARYKNNVLWLKVESAWNDSIDSTTILSATDIENQRFGTTDRPGVITGSVDDDRHFRSLAVKQDWTLAAADAWLLAAGFELKRLEAEYAYDASVAVSTPFDTVLDNRPFTTRSVETAPRGSQYAAYTELRVQPIDRLTFDAGLRWDQQTYTTARDDEQVSPRFNVLYRVGENTELRLAYGRYYQAQEINELQVSDGVYDFHPAQRAQHLVASFEHALGSGLDLRIEAYRKKYRSLMPRFENIFDPLALIPELAIDRVRIDADSARSEGLELSLTGTGANDLAWWASYTWSRTDDVVQGVSIRRGWDQTHALNAGFGMDWNAWSFSAAAVVHTGWPKTLLQAETVENPDGSTALVAVTGPRNGSRHAVFGSLDARVSRRFGLPRGDLTVFLEITNLTDRENPCCTEYSVGVDENGDPALQAGESAWLPVVPSLGIVWRF